MQLHTELTIGAYFEQKVAERGDADFIVYADRDLRWSWNQFNDRVDNLAKGLLAVQMGLSMVLLVGAGLFARSLRNLGAADLGLARDTYAQRGHRHPRPLRIDGEGR